MRSIVNLHEGIPKSPEVNIRDYYFGMTNVTVILEWIQESSISSYNVSINPAAEIRYIHENILLLIISYNTSYYVNVAARLCGKYSAVNTLVPNHGNKNHACMLCLH